MTAPPRKSDLPRLNPKLVGGHWTLEPLTVRQRDRLDLRIVASHALVTAKEVFAVAPGLTSISVVVLANDHGMAPGQWTFILIAHITRANLLGLTTAELVRAEVVLESAAKVTVKYRGEGPRLLPVDNSPLAATPLASISEIEPVGSRAPWPIDDAPGAHEAARFRS